MIDSVLTQDEWKNGAVECLDEEDSGASVTFTVLADGELRVQTREHTGAVADIWSDDIPRFIAIANDAMDASHPLKMLSAHVDMLRRNAEDMPPVPANELRAFADLLAAYFPAR